MGKASWSIALVSVPFLLNPSPASLPLWTLFVGLQQLNLVAHPDRAVFDHLRADTTATL
jgi:hypothetical protein